MPALGDVVPSADDVGFYLVVIEGRDSGRWIALGERPLSGGRDSHLDLVFEDTEVSRLHVLVSVLDGAVVVEEYRIDERNIRRRATHHHSSIGSRGQCLACRRSQLQMRAGHPPRRGTRRQATARSRSSGELRPVTVATARIRRADADRLDVPSLGATGGRCLRISAARLAHVGALPHRRLRSRRRRRDALGLGTQRTSVSGRCLAPTSRIPSRCSPA